MEQRHVRGEQLVKAAAEIQMRERMRALVREEAEARLAAAAQCDLCDEAGGSSARTESVSSARTDTRLRASTGKPWTWTSCDRIGPSSCWGGVPTSSVRRQCLLKAARGYAGQTAVRRSWRSERKNNE